jgi:hypothetical protein
LLTVRGEGYRLNDFDIVEPVIDLAALEIPESTRELLSARHG